MKKMKITCAIITLMLVTASAFAQSESAEQLIVPLSSPGKPYSLKVNLVSGSIKVVSYEGKDIVIDVTTPGKGQKANRHGDMDIDVDVNINENDNDNDNDNEEHSKDVEKGMKKISTSGSYEVTAKENDNIVSVNTSNPNKTFIISLKVPQDVKLKLSTVNNGNIVVENVKGELEITNVNGEIKLTNISGSVVSNTVNGNITTTFNAVNPNAPMAFSTLNGNVNVTFPASTKANLKLKSDMGDVYSDFDIEIDKTQPQTNKTNEPGMYKIKKDAWIYGKINGGGPEVLMKNMHGNIYVKKGK